LVGHGIDTERLAADSQIAWDDYLHPYWLGVAELAAYPVLLATDNAEYIGAWLVFKTLPLWGVWSKQRSSYNRFLVGNALVLILSYGVARSFLGPA